MKKVEIQVHIHSEKEKTKALKAVSSIRGVDSISIDMGKRMMTVIGDVDPVCVICKLRSSWCPELLTVGPKEEKKAEEKKKEEPKKCDCGDTHSISCHCYRPPNPYPCPPMAYQIHYCSEDYPSACVIT